MKFNRFFKSGGGDYDPRQHNVAEWLCDVCGHKHWDAHVDTSNYKIVQEKTCPNCGSLSKEDMVQTLKLRRTQLVEQKSTIEREIEEICSKIENYSVADEIENLTRG